jgi:hypothetical protein
MLVVLRRFASAAVCAVAVASLAAPAAEAATITNGAVTALTATTATLNGTIATGGYATSWQFQIGTTASYGAHSTTQTIAAGVTAPVPVQVHLVHLIPNTTYHFRIAATVVVPVAKYPYYYFFPGFSVDATFTTKTVGNVGLGSTKVKVRKGIAFVALKCSSTVKCSGKLSASAKSHGKSVSCFSHTVSLNAGKKGTFKLKVSNGCLSLLKKAHKHTIKASLVWKTTTGQGTLKKTISLIGV